MPDRVRVLNPAKQVKLERLLAEFRKRAKAGLM